MRRCCPETHTALLRVLTGGDRDRLVWYDVTTGATHAIDPPRRGAFFALQPDGSGVLMGTYGSGRRPGRVGTLDWDGTRTWLPARTEGSAITSADGRTLVTAAGRRWWVTDLAAGTSSVIDTRVRPEGVSGRDDASRRMASSSSVVRSGWA